MPDSVAVWYPYRYHCHSLVSELAHGHVILLVHVYVHTDRHHIYIYVYMSDARFDHHLQPVSVRLSESELLHGRLVVLVRECISFMHEYEWCSMPSRHASPYRYDCQCHFAINLGAWLYRSQLVYKDFCSLYWYTGFGLVGL